MKINSINKSFNFGLKFSEKAEELFQKSQDYIADKSIVSNDNDIVIKNNLNRDLLECMLGDEFVLDAKLYQKKVSNESYAFMIKNKNTNNPAGYFLCISNLNNILNGKVWNTIIKKIRKVEKFLN